MFAGPNGSGKTSIVYQFAEEFSPTGLFRLHRFINADEIQQQLTSTAGFDTSHLGISLNRVELIAALTTYY